MSAIDVGFISSLEAVLLVVVALPAVEGFSDCFLVKFVPLTCAPVQSISKHSFFVIDVGHIFG